MPGGIVEIDRTIGDIAIPIPTLRIGHTWDNGIWLEEEVDIRRTRPLVREKK
jgi:hypothetical protein